MALSVDDRLAIHDLVARYNQATDGGDRAARAVCFTADAVFESTGRTARGRDAIVGGEHDPGRQHWVTNIVLDGDGDSDGDEVRMNSYLIVFELGPPRRVRLTGRYEDTVRRVDGRWLFAHRRFIRDQLPPS